jgi:hypothetical protein
LAPYFEYRFGLRSFFFLSFFLSYLVSLSIATATGGDITLRPPSLLKLSVKLFSKVSSPSSPTYFNNAPWFGPRFEGKPFIEFEIFYL